MANTLITLTQVTREIGRGFVNSVKFFRNNNRTYDDKYKQGGAKVGYTVNARMPVRFVANDGQAFQAQNLLESSVPITLTNQKQVAFSWSTAQATMEIQDARERYLVPAGQTLGNAADVLAYGAVYPDIYNAVGTLGTVPSAALTFLQAGVKLTDLSSPTSGRVAVLDTWAMANLANAQSTLFHPGGKVSETWRDGQLGANQLGIDEWYVDQNRSVHTSGTFTASTPLVDGASQTGSTININGWASGATTLNKGDIFTVAGVYSVNPVSKVSTGRLQQFVVTATTSDSSGATATLPISPSIITSGALQTVSNSPANDAVVTVWSANPAGGTLATTVSPQSMVFHPDAFAFVMADLMEPEGGAETNYFRDKETGISIRYARQWQGMTDQNASRLDILIGAATLQARMACRVVG